ncbi:MAG: BREX system ATP-binding domain-containing protein [bacterium]
MERGLARAIVSKLGATGTPPEFGLDAFTIGLERYLGVLEEEYLKGILTWNLSSFKLVTGNYGGGKTHFLYSVRNLAFRNNYCVSYVSLSPTECPFDRLELVYRAVVAGISVPVPSDQPVPGTERGIEAVLRHWYAARRVTAERVTELKHQVEELAPTESSSFSNAVRAAFDALVADDAEGFNSIVQWLKGEEVDREVRLRHRISERVDKATAFRMLRSLIQWVHSIGYNGLVLLFDEAERGMSLSSSRDRRRALDNLRQLVDECGNSRLPGAMIFYAVPDENLLLEGSGGVYEALKQRLRSQFSGINPVGVRVNLDDLGIDPEEFLLRLGTRLAAVFEAAYDVELVAERRDRVIGLLARLAVAAFMFDISYRRLFVVSLVEALHKLRAEPGQEFDRKAAEKLLRVTSQRLEQTERADVEREEF